MIKNYFSNLNLDKVNIKKFLKKHYVSFFKQVPLLFCFIITAMINALLLRILTVGNFIYVKPLLIDVGVLFILSSFMFLFKSEKKKKKYLIVLSIITSLICLINSVYYTYYSSFVSVSLLATATFVVEVGDAVVDKVIRVIDLIYIWQPIFVYYYYVKENNKKKLMTNNKEFDRKFSFVNTFVTGVVLLVLTSAFMTKTEWGRLIKMWNRESVVSSFGVYAYQINDLVQSLEPKLNNLFGHDKALKTVIDYYDSNPENDNKNKYTGIFEGKNVIVIHAESLQDFVLGKSFNGVEVAPFLTKLSSEGIYFNNYYSEVGVGTSSDAEFTFSTSLMPSSSGTVFVNYFDREYQTIQKSFSDKGYYTFSMHGNVGDFWNRSIMHKNMGYDKFYSKSSFDIDEEIGLGLSDKSFFRQAIPMLQEIAAKDEPFYGTLITLTNHTPWSDLELMDEYDTSWTVEIDGEEIVRDYLNDTTLGDYFRSVHYMDQAFEQFFNDLDDVGLLEDTVLVIYGDHDARISKKDYNLMYNYDPYTDSIKKQNDDGYVDYNEYEYELNRKVPFIIWTKDKNVVKKVSTVTGMIDANPILSNLFGLEKNEFSLGHDVLGQDLTDNTVVFTDGSYVTNKIYYNGQNEEIYSIGGGAVENEYIVKNAKYASDIIDVSNNIIIYDLISEIKEKSDIVQDNS